MADFDALFANVCARLERSGNVAKMSAAFAECPDDAARLEFVRRLDEVNEALDDYVAEHVAAGGRARKCRETAAIRRAEGNRHYRANDNRLALASYNASVMAAEGESLALAYANRSAVFCDAGQWLRCLRDIRLAFDEGYPPQLAPKLHERRAKCHVALGEQCAGRAEDEPPVAAVEKRVADATRSRPVELNREPNPLVPSASRSVRLVSCPGRGRCLVATEDLEPGTTVIAEKAFASILLGEYKASHCHHCLHWTPGPVPCRQCSQVAFCSTTCRDEAWRGYHRAECGRTDALERSGVGPHALLAVRTVHRLDGDALRAALARRPDHDGPYASDDYATVRGLVTHSDKRSVADLFRRTVLAAFLARIGGIDDHDGAALVPELLRLVQSYPCNAHELCQLTTDDRPAAGQRLLEVGAGALPVLSLVNHSCDPNVSRSCYGDVVCATVIRRIAAGDELLDSYGYHYATHEPAERRLRLRAQYHFDCGCPACEHRWPLYAAIPPLGRDPVAAAVRSRLDAFARLRCDEDRAAVLEHLAGFARLVSALDKDRAVERPVREHNDCQEALKQCLALLAAVTPAP